MDALYEASGGQFHVMYAGASGAYYVFLAPRGARTVVAADAGCIMMTCTAVEQWRMVGRAPSPGDVLTCRWRIAKKVIKVCCEQGYALVMLAEDAAGRNQPGWGLALTPAEVMRLRDHLGVVVVSNTRGGRNLKATPPELLPLLKATGPAAPWLALPPYENPEKEAKLLYDTMLRVFDQCMKQTRRAAAETQLTWLKDQIIAVNLEADRDDGAADESKEEEEPSAAKKKPAAKKKKATRKAASSDDDESASAEEEDESSSEDESGSEEESEEEERGDATSSSDDAVSSDREAAAAPLPVDEDDEDATLCAACKTGGDNLLSCDGCAVSYHLGCVRLREMPQTVQWFCRDCLSDEEE